ncbi:MAG TPA: hypothetical protein VLV31_01285 [Candidatus Acidoferrales bacterium]|nr:hypothetical protein [Candidatus Acidoferrales bacterium]
MELITMSFKPPCPVTLSEVKIKVEDLEPILRPAESPLLLRKYEPRLLKLPDGKKMVVRMATEEDIPVMLQTTRSVMDEEKDFYDLVSSRVYAEILSHKRKRVKDYYCLVGVLEGELAAVANARLWDTKVAISLHTMTFKRGAGIGALMYLAKMEHAFENLGMEEWWATYESYTGIRYWGLGLAQFQKPYPEIQHELGGARVFFNTKEQWNSFVKPKYEPRLGERPVPPDLLKASLNPKKPDHIDL